MASGGGSDQVWTYRSYAGIEAEQFLLLEIQSADCRRFESCSAVLTTNIFGKRQEVLPLVCESKKFYFK
jgi:hypothetical protein